MPIEGKAVLNKDHSFTDFPITISNNVKSSVSNWSMLGNGQQTGTPTPDTPIMPEFVGVRTGNLFDPNGVTTNERGEVRVGVELPAGPYCITNLSNAVCYWRIGVETQTGNQINPSAPYVYINASDTLVVWVNTNSNKNIMINAGSTGLPYEPYGWAEKITCAGQTVPVYLGQTQTVRRIRKRVFTGAEQIGNYDATYSRFSIVFSDSLILGVRKSPVISSHLIGISDGRGIADVPNNAIYSDADSGNGRWFIKTTDYTTAADFKAYLASEYAAGTPVTVWYVLATPTTGIVNEPLCKIGTYADELLSTSEGTPQLTLSTEEPNIISFETDLQPSKFNIKYYEKDYTKIKDIQMQIPTAKTYNYTEYPITISNAVSSNCSIDLFGNSIQNGTPSPDNPIIPEFCGDKTRNLFDPNSTRYHMGKGTNNVITSAPNGAMFYIKAEPNTTYVIKVHNTDSTFVRLYLSNAPIVENVTESYNVISESETTINPEVTISNTYYEYLWIQVGGTWYTEHGGSSIMLNSGSTTLPYEPYGYKIPITNSEQTNTVYLGEVPTVHRIKKLVLKGDEGTWQKSTTYQGNFYNQLLNTPRLGIPILCSHAVYTSQFTPQSYVYGKCGVDGGASVKNLNLFIGESSWSVSDFQQYLATQYVAGTPVTVWYVLTEPETGIVNEPLAKIGDYSDELQTTIQLEPFNQNTISIDTQLQPSKVSLTYKTKEPTDPYKSIKYALDNNNNYLYKSPYFYTWEGIREIVRAGKASQYYPIGSIIYDNFNESTGTAFQVVAYDNHFDPTLTAQGYTHSMTLCELLLTDVITFDAQEAFLYTEVDIPAGTYKFTIPNYDATYGGNKTYYFTSTTTLPSGSQIVMNWPYQQTPKTVTGYVGPNPQTNTTALSGFSALTLTEWVDGTSPEATDLGTIAGPTTQLGTSNYGQMNHIHRVRYGSNNYLQSGIRQYINSNSAANTWWTPQTVFDRPYGSRSSAGRLTKLNQDLVSVMATPEIKSRTNSYFETTSLDGTTFTLSTDYTINTDKMFLLSPMEVNFNTTDTTIGTTLNYYVGANNDKRIKIRKSNNTAYYWWLRTPYPSTASSVRGVDPSGALYSYTANTSRGAAPACVIQ